jgi:hypothetical protein
MIRYFLVHVILFLIVYSCNSSPKKIDEILIKAGNNQKELNKIIEHYKKTHDAEKLKAAYFLIANMSNKHGRYGNIVAQYFPVIEQLHKYADNKVDIDTINKLIKLQWDSVEQKVGAINETNYQYLNDYSTITADYLIENIDYAFKAWKEKPWARHLNFDQFCEFILPYRISDEPLQFYRKQFFNEFHWIDDSLKNTSDPIKACLILNRYLAKKFVFCSKLSKCPLLGINDMYRLCGGICEHRYYMLAMIMRSVGIPVAIDNTPQRNNEVGEHSWMVLMDAKGRIRAFNGGELDVSFPDSVYNPIGKGYSTKVYRNTFADMPHDIKEGVPASNIPVFFKNNNIKDVTSDYEFPQISLKFELNTTSSLDCKKMYLCCFGYSDQIVPVAYSEVSGRKVIFDHTGCDCVYFPAYFTNGYFTAAANPVYVSIKGKITTLTPNKLKQIYTRLTRKFYPQQYLYSMYDFAKWMVGANLQGSDNRSFTNPTTLFTIDTPYYYFVEKEINSPKKFRYYRYISNKKDPIRIAEIEFIPAEGEYTGEINKRYTVFGYASKDTTHHYKAIFENAFDNNITTNFNAPAGSWTAIDYGSPVLISKIGFLVRNDLNVIEIGDEYELLYFDMTWISLGKKTADKNYIDYSNVPENALLLLRDLTKGREERIFIYKHNKQVWL